MGNLFCCIQVDQSTVAFTERFGKFAEVLEPGCHFLPWILGYRCAGKLSLQLQQLDVRCQAKTKDYEFVSVVAYVQYRVLADKAIDAFYKLSNTRRQIETYVIHAIRATVAKLNLDDALERKNEIAKAVEDELKKAMCEYGYEIVRTLMIDIEPPLHFKKAMNKINAENREARAEKILQIKKAEAEAVSKNLSGLSIARQHQVIVEALTHGALGFAENVPGTTTEDVIDMDLVTQCLNTMRDICAAHAMPLSEINL